MFSCPPRRGAGTDICGLSNTNIKPSIVLFQITMMIAWSSRFYRICKLVSSTRIWTWNLSMIWTMGIRALLLAAALLSKYTRNSFIFRTIFQYWFIDMQSHAYPLSNHLISLLTKNSNQSKLKFLLFYRSEFYIVIVVFH